MKSSDFDNLRQAIRRLNGLLEDPQPGHFTWWGFFSERATEIREELDRLLGTVQKVNWP